MRITGGLFKGRVFSPPASKWPTRPTTDIAREALFNILANVLDFEEIKALDLFGGSGAHTYELLSRGCTDVVYVDHFKPCHVFTRKMLLSFQSQEYVRLFVMDYLDFINQTKDHFDYIFAGPPYPLKAIPEIPDHIFSKNLLNPNGILVLEHNPDHCFEAHSMYWKSKNYGQTFFSFFKG
ncbi:MAG: RsmD family RNA methyltransferase [Saprospiraceae bacterium]|nr:RsmD family RNA methyltransferase [Saprospiraceae bacterium]